MLKTCTHKLPFKVCIAWWSLAKASIKESKLFKTEWFIEPL